MQVKLFEVRDRATNISVAAISLDGADDREAVILGHVGFGGAYHGGPFVILMDLSDQKASYDPFFWTGNRTMKPAHDWIIDHWNDLKSGDVVDVEKILGEKS